MPRNGSGTFTLAQPPFVPQTPISSAAVNSDLSDIASALTGSLARDGQGGMTAELPLANAGFSYASDPNTGMHRTGADAQAIECGGVDVVEVDASGATVNGALEVTGPITSSGVAILPIGLGPLPWSGLTAPPKWVLANGQSLLRASYPDLWAFAASEIALGNTLYTNGNGTTTFTVADHTGRVGAGREAVATRLTSTYFGGNSTVLGAVGGLESNTLTTAQLASHSHGVTDPTHAHFGGVGSSGGVGPGALQASAATAFSQSIQSSATGISIQDAGSGSPHNNVQPTIIVNYIIYAGA